MKTFVFFLSLTVLVGMRPTTVMSTSDPVLNACKTEDGNDRPFPCEFQIHTIWLMGKNNEVLAKSTANGQVLKLPMSKAVSSTTSSNGGSLVYKVSIDFSRINKASFTPPFYTLSQSTITKPISPGETTLIQKLTQISAALPPPFARPNRITFPLKLYYATSSFGNDPSLIAPLQLMQLENPVTFAKLSQLHYLQDRAEAWRTLSLDVYFKK